MRPLWGLVVFTFAFSATSIGQERDTTRAAGIPELEQRIRQILERTKTPGASVALVSRDKVLWTAGIGKADLSDGSAVTPDTLFRIGSITKSFVALSVMMLVEERRLSLDDRLAQLVPDVAFFNRWESTDPIRLVHLLEHTAGWDMHSLLEASYKGPAPVSLREALALRPATRTSRWKPGTGFAYSNIGAPVVALIVEKLTGRRFEDFVGERIFQPLGMRSATFFAASTAAVRLAAGYDPHLRKVEYSNQLMRPAGAVSASARDMAALVRFYLNRGRLDEVTLVKPETVDRIEWAESSLAARNGIRAGYGLFNHTKNHKGFTFHGHTGGIDGFGAEMFYLPEVGFGYVFMINTSSGASFHQIGQSLRDFVIRDFPIPSLPQGIPGGAAQLAAWEGYYEPQNPPIEYFRLMNRLMGVMRVRAEGQSLVVQPMLGGAGRKLVMLSEGHFRCADCGLAGTLFVRDERGARLMVADQGSIFRELPGWKAWSRMSLAILCPALMMSPLLLALWWIPRLLLRKGPRPLKLAAYLWPLAAAFSFAGMLALNSVTGETAWRLAYFSPYSAGLFVLSLLFPTASFMGVVAAVRAAGSGMRRKLLLYSLICSLWACFVSAYLGFQGFIGIRTWRL